MVFEEKIRIFNILTYITLFFFGHKKLFVQIVVKSLQSAGLLLGRSEDRKQDYSFDRPRHGQIWGGKKIVQMPKMGGKTVAHTYWLSKRECPPGEHCVKTVLYK